jgi:hypothetical protein
VVMQRAAAQRRGNNGTQSGSARCTHSVCTYWVCCVQWRCGFTCGAAAAAAPVHPVQCPRLQQLLPAAAPGVPAQADE